MDKQEKQTKKLIDTVNSLTVTKGKGNGGIVKGKGVKHTVTDEDLTSGGGHSGY